ncbi:MAG: enoyl-CoA hydratase [Dehalococcoidia bacterium]|nr:enoyl-CoA hydratase [Dehalococcoidia bacterium]
MEHNPFDIKIKDRIATVIFNRPEKHNAINYEGWLKLLEEVKTLSQNKNVRAVVFSGSGGKSFSAGADIKDFEENRKDSHTAMTYSEAFDGALDAIESMPFPTISKINGICVGGGCELAMATDIRIASNESKFGIPVAKLGILIGYREMKRLINLVGSGNASYILLSGRIFGASEALQMGLVNQVVSEKELDTVVSDLVSEIVPLAPLSQERHKKILSITIKNPSLTNLTKEEEFLPFSNFDSDDFKEGQLAFVKHQTPDFKGH